MEKPGQKSTRSKRKVLSVLVIVIILFSVAVLFLLDFENMFANPTATRVACIGDSITEGFGYPSELGKLLGANYSVRNFGVGGSTVLLSSNKPYMNQTAMARAKEFQPNIVVIMLGTNDASPAYYGQIENFVFDYKALIDSFQNLPSKPKVWLVLPPPIFNTGPGPNGTNLVQGIIPRIQQVANELSLPVANVYAALANHPEDFLSDGVHPNGNGVKIITNEVFKAIS